MKVEPVYTNEQTTLEIQQMTGSKEYQALIRSLRCDAAILTAAATTLPDPALFHSNSSKPDVPPPGLVAAASYLIAANILEQQIALPHYNQTVKAEP